MPEKPLLETRVTLVEKTTSDIKETLKDVTKIATDTHTDVVIVKNNLQHMNGNFGDLLAAFKETSADNHRILGNHENRIKTVEDTYMESDDIRAAIKVVDDRITRIAWRVVWGMVATLTGFLGVTFSPYWQKLLNMLHFQP